MCRHEEDTGCLHLIGYWEYKYEGGSLLFEGEKFPPDTDHREDFDYCPYCGKKLR